tara:strand:- start:4109 stop:4444 length:336 start_codon:yes stop_codon:yes gene_type:complete
MSNLSDALKNILSDIDDMPDSELQATFDKHKNGVVGAAISDLQAFGERKNLMSWDILGHHYEILELKLKSRNRECLSSFYWEISTIVDCYERNLEMAVVDAANDENYLMAA